MSRLNELLPRIRNNDPSLIALNLKGYGINDNGAKSLASALATGNSKIKRLDLGDNKIRVDGAKSLADALVTKDTRITRLDLWKNNISANGAKSLADVLMTGNTKITRLELWNNRIGADGAKSLADALATGRTMIRTLNLGGNNIGDDGAKSLANALATGRTMIKTLDLWNNGISADGAKSLTDALVTGRTTVTTLDLWNNGISDNGTKSLADMLVRGNTMITALYIGSNQISDDGAKSLANALVTGNTRITTLNLWNNSIDVDLLKIINVLLNRTMNMNLSTEEEEIFKNFIKGQSLQIAKLQDHLAILQASEVYLRTQLEEQESAHEKQLFELEKHSRARSEQYQQRIQQLEEKESLHERQLAESQDHLALLQTTELSLRAQLKEQESIHVEQLAELENHSCAQSEQYEQRIQSLEEQLLVRESETQSLHVELQESHNKFQQHNSEENTLVYVERTIIHFLTHMRMLPHNEHEGDQTHFDERESNNDDQQEQLEHDKQRSKPRQSLPSHLISTVSHDMSVQWKNQAEERRILRSMEAIAKDAPDTFDAMKQFSEQLQRNRQQQKEYLSILQNKFQSHQSVLRSQSLHTLFRVLQSLIGSGVDKQLQFMDRQLQRIQLHIESLTRTDELHRKFIDDLSKLRPLYDEMQRIRLRAKQLELKLELGHDDLTDEELTQQETRLNEMYVKELSLCRTLEQLDRDLFEQSQQHSMHDVTLRVIRERQYRDQQEMQRNRRRHLLRPSAPIGIADHDELDVRSPDRLRQWLRDRMHLLVNRKSDRDYEQIRVLASTNMSQVFLVKLRGSFDDTNSNTSDLVVLKRLPWSPQSEKHIRTEIRLMSELKHPHIVPLRAVFIEGSGIYLEMDHCEQGDLSQWLQSTPQRTFHEVRNALRQLLQGVGFLHARGIVHRDLKPGNVLVDRNGVIKLSDYGISKDTNSMFQSTTATAAAVSTYFHAGTVEYMAPERQQGVPACESTDMWSVGVIVGKTLFPNWHPHPDGQGGIVLPPSPPSASTGNTFMTTEQHRAAVDLLHKLLVVSNNPNSNNIMRLSRSSRRPSSPFRPTAVEVLNHPFFTLDALESRRREQSILESSDKLQWFQSFMRQLREEQRQHLQESVSEGAEDELLFLDIDRKNVIPDVLHSLQNQLTNPEDIFRDVRVTFQGETGVDAGGLTNDLFTQFFTQLFDTENGLFVAVDDEESPHLLVPSDEPDSDDESQSLRNESTYEMAGRLLMKCLLDEKPQVLPLHPMVLSVLLDREDPSLPNDCSNNTVNASVEWWLNEAEVSCCPRLVAQLRSMRSNVHSGQYRLQDLLVDESVTNIDQYIVDLLRQKIVTGEHGNRLRYLRAMRRGFLDFVPKREQFIDQFVKKLSREELQLLLAGPSYLDADMLVSQVDCDSTNRTFTDFMHRLLHSLDNSQLRRFLLWTTALGALPASGQLSRRVNVIASNRFMSHTCFNELEIDSSYLPPSDATSEDVETAFTRFRGQMVHMMNLAVGSTMED